MKHAPNGITYRNLACGELEGWLDFLVRELFPGDPVGDVLSIWESNGEKDLNGVFVAVDADGRIVGSVSAECRELELAGAEVPTGIISGVGVKKEYRGMGIGEKLLELCHEYLKERGAKAAYLFSKPDTLSYYLRLGYLNCRQRPGEGFYRMLRLISPFSAGGGKLLLTTEDIIDRMNEE